MLKSSQQAPLKLDLNSPAFMRDPFPTFRDLRARGDLVRLKLPLIGNVWMTTTHETATALLKDKTNFAMDPRNAGRRNVPGLQWWMPKSISTLASNMLTSDEPNHRRLRGLVDEAFHRRGIAEMSPRIEEIADQLIDTLAANEPVDLMETFARPFPLAVICEVLGLPASDRAMFMASSAKLTTASSPVGLIKALPGINRLLRYLRTQFDAARKSPSSGLISELVRAEQDGDKLTEDELLAMVFLLLIAGHETTTHLVSGGLLALLQNPDQKARLMAEWDREGLAVEELLRFVSPVQMSKPRTAVRDQTFAGVEIKRGDFVMAFLASANSDPAQFEAPETLDIFRQPNKHLGFGAGIHFCLGIQLARAETAIALRRLLTRYPNLRLACDETELGHHRRLGLRALQSLPVVLDG